MKLSYRSMAKFDAIVADIRRELSYPIEGLRVPPPRWKTAKGPPIIGRAAVERRKDHSRLASPRPASRALIGLIYRPNHG